MRLYLWASLWTSVGTMLKMFALLTLRKLSAKRTSHCANSVWIETIAIASYRSETLPYFGVRIAKSNG